MHRNGASFNICSLVKFLLLCLCVAEVISRRCPSCIGASEQRRSDALPNLADCCACGRAVYNITFIGKWDKRTQPRHYPGLMASWSDMIGCTHNKRYVMWHYGGQASRGVQRLTEWGSTGLLEEEMRNQGRNVLSIIKTRGIYRGVGASSTQLTASPNHHFLSMIARIKPSPDWGVGVDRLDLCSRNCTWKKLVVENLYPWDAGTDDGIEFTSVNTKSNPQRPIQRITADLHNHTSASFHRKRGIGIHPMAQLRLELLRVSGACDSRKASTFPPEVPRVDCVVIGWSQWTTCSVTCGTGKQYRVRAIQTKPSQDGIKCPDTTQKRKCFEVKCQEPNADPRADCKVSVWSPWSKCQGVCKRGLKSRTRVVLRRPQKNGKKCPNLIRWKKCKLPKCKADMIWEKHGKCVLSEWTPWSQCTKPCNHGKMFRYRKIISEGANQEECIEKKLKDKKRCNTHRCQA